MNNPARAQAILREHGLSPQGFNTKQNQKKRTKKSHLPSKQSYTWQELSVTVLPLVIFLVTIIQIAFFYRYFDVSIYDNQSYELLPGSINSLSEKIFVFNSLAIMLINFIGMIGVIFKQKWSFSVLIFGGVVSLLNSFAMLNPIGMLAGPLWISLLLQIRKEFV